jgi:hypothetical protein
METLRVKTKRRTQLVDVTAEVQRVVAESGVDSGVCYVFVPNAYRDYDELRRVTQIRNKRLSFQELAAYTSP